jgi:hypothetical protein
MASWEQIILLEGSPEPPPRAAASLTVVGTKLYLFGGVEFDSFYDDLWMLDVSDLASGMLQWVQCVHLPTNEDDEEVWAGEEGVEGHLHGAAAATHGGAGDNEGGEDGAGGEDVEGGSSGVSEEDENDDDDDDGGGDDEDDDEDSGVDFNLDDDDDDEDVNDTDYQEMPDARWGHTATAVGEVLVLFGGSCPGKAFNDVWAIDLTDDAEKSREKERQQQRGVGAQSARATAGAFSQADGSLSPSLSRQSSAASSVGADAGGAPLSPSSGAAFGLPKYQSLRWHRQRVDGAGPQPRGGHSAAVIGNAVYIFGGNTTPPTVRA